MRFGEQRMEIEEISVEELSKKVNAGEEFVLLDVRREDEHQFVNIGGALIPLSELPNRLNELDKSKEVIVYCRSGARSAAATRILLDNGFERVKNLKGGILAWSDNIDPTKPKY